MFSGKNERASLTSAAPEINETAGNERLSEELLAPEN
jgi:hypothetical protein